MQSFSRGWSFLKEAWSMAFKDKDLIKPSIFALIVGAIVSILGAIPIIIAAVFLGDAGRIGQAILAIMGAFLVFLNFVVTYVFSGMTVYLIYEYLTTGDGKMSTAWSIVRRDFFDLVTLAAVSTVVNVLKNAANRNRRRGGGTRRESDQWGGRSFAGSVDGSGLPHPARHGHRRYQPGRWGQAGGADRSR